MNPINAECRGRGSWALVAAAMTAFLVAGCGSSNGGSGSGGQTGTGGAGVGTGGSAAGTGGSTVGTGGATSGTGGGAAGTGGNSAGTGGSADGTGGASSGTGGRVAGTGGTTSATGGRGGNGGTGGAGGSGGFPGGTGGATGGRGALTLTSTSLTSGAAFMAANTCAGANQSPPFMWTAGPAGTQSYAIVLLDTANMRYHWAIWNIPAVTMALPAALPAGASITAPVSAMQAITGTVTPAYQGPCPNGAVHTYVFTVYALDVATLPGVANGTMSQPVFMALQSHTLASGTLSGTSNAARP